MGIHPTAQVDRRAEIHPDADIGALVVIDGPVQIGARTRVLPHAVIVGKTRLGSDNVVHYGAVLGDVPQDLSHAGAESFVEIADRNVFREGVTVHRGTKPGSTTKIGSDNYLMVNSHVAHNCRIGDHVVVVNGALLAGHVEVGDRALISGNAAVHQYARIGQLALVRGLGRATRDVPPFCIMDETGTLRGVNLIGLRRAGFDAGRIRAVRRAFTQLFGSRRNLSLAMSELEQDELTEDVRSMLEFIRASKRGICGGRRSGDDGAEDGDAE
jgi:UDP-N-acetylglucosamine acyltransferase